MVEELSLRIWEICFAQIKTGFRGMKPLVVLDQVCHQAALLLGFGTDLAAIPDSPSSSVERNQPRLKKINRVTRTAVSVSDGTAEV